MLNKSLFTLASAVTAVTLTGLLLPQAAVAVPFSTDLAVTSRSDFNSNDLNDPNADGDPSNFSVIQGGVTTLTTWDDTGILVGANPLLGTLTDINDGIAVTADMDCDPNPGGCDFDVIVELDIGVMNNSATDTYKITFKVNFDHLVDADGSGAEAELEFFFELFQNAMNTLQHRTRILSDVGGGNEAEGETLGIFNGDLGDNGGELTLVGMDFFDVILTPGEMIVVRGEFANDLDLGDVTGDSDVEFTGALTIANVMCLRGAGCGVARVPEPGTLALFGLGLIGLGLARRRKGL